MDTTPSVRGFTLLEVLFVVVIAVLTLSIASQVYADYLERSAAQRSAQLFARDLTMARMNAIQTRSPVTVRFDEGSLEYSVVRASGEVITRRDYASGAEVELSEVDLQMPGDSLVFNGRGIADLSAVAGSLGTAVFQAGGERFTVSFNSMGASRVDG